MSDSLSNDYNLLTTKGNIGFYNSCETTEIFIFDRVNSTIFNLYTISVFQEKHTSKEKYKNRTPLTSNRIEINDRYFIGILQYELELDEIRENFDTLNNNEIWISNHNKNSSKNYSDLKKLNKQFIHSNEESRINLILKNNYFSGSYILEFFDENKNFDFLIEDDELFEGVSNEILEYIPINLYQVKDRLGNFIFQFPVTIVNIDVSSSDSWDSVDFKFYWNPKIEEIPDCHLDICSILDNNYLGFSIEEYNKKDVQTVYTGNSDSSNIIKVWNDNSNLLLFSCTEHFTNI